MVSSMTLEFASGDATIMATVELGERPNHGTLSVFEHLRVEEGRPRRWKYSYHGSIGGKWLFRFDRDPTGHPEMSEHVHLAEKGDERIPCERVTLSDVAERLWASIEEWVVQTPVQTSEPEISD